MFDAALRLCAARVKKLALPLYRNAAFCDVGKEEGAARTALRAANQRGLALIGSTAPHAGLVLQGNGPLSDT
ncbi:hypothetical protein ABTE71_19715, partial [Acinetobacter baumannii]